MTGLIFGKTEADLEAKLAPRNLTAAAARARGVAVGTGDDLVAQLGEWAAVGVQRIMLQWMDLDDMDGLERLATAVLPQVS